MESKEEKLLRRVPTSILLISLLLSASSALEFYGFYLTDLRMFTLPALGIAGLLAALGLLRLKSWGLWLSYALYPPRVVQAAIILWSLFLSEGFQPGSYGGLLEVGLIAYLVLLTLCLPVLWRSRENLQ
ncbi:MAG: hypothetical protein ACETVR_02160 [Candidatus Bathyarchaeia archaeon]